MGYTEISVERTFGFQGGCSAIALTTKEDIEVPADKLAAFQIACVQWDTGKFEEGYSFVSEVRSDVWAKWVEMFPVVD